MYLDKSRLSRRLASLAFLIFIAAPAWPAEQEGSLDSMWKEQEAPGGSENLPSHADKVAGDKATRAATLAQKAERPNSVAGADSAPPRQANSAVPLEQFLHTSFILGTGWPSIGPFKTTTPGPYTLIDPSQNRLGLAVEDNKVVAAEVQLVNSNKPNQNFDNLQMAADFLMEAVGIKPKKIDEINLQLASNSGLTTGNFTGPLGLIVEPFVVSVQKEATAGQSDTPSMKVRVSDREFQGSESIVIPVADLGAAGTSVSELPNDMPLPSTSPPGKITEHAAKRGSASGSEEKSGKNPGQNSAEKYEKLLSMVTSPDGASVGPPSAAPRGLAGAQVDQLKHEFLELIEAWQRLKKTAVRQRETTELSQVLAGPALSRQSSAIKWLAANHKYYDMTPKGAQVNRLEEQTPDKKYYVYAQVKESSKYVDEATGQILKDSENTYNVRYTVEKSEDHWVISDSALIKPNSSNSTQSQAQAQSQAPKTQR
jgi:hypothetical protein